jgi:hypothetical protein
MLVRTIFCWRAAQKLLGKGMLHGLHHRQLQSRPLDRMSGGTLLLTLSQLCHRLHQRHRHRQHHQRRQRHQFLRLNPHRSHLPHHLNPSLRLPRHPPQAHHPLPQHRLRLPRHPALPHTLHQLHRRLASPQVLPLPLLPDLKQTEYLNAESPIDQPLIHLFKKIDRGRPGLPAWNRQVAHLRLIHL